jgi:hypothetical protein
VFLNTAGLLNARPTPPSAPKSGPADRYRLLGFRGIVETVRRAAAPSGARGILIANANDRVAGNLDSVPPGDWKTGWIDFPSISGFGENKRGAGPRLSPADDYD